MQAQNMFEKRCYVMAKDNKNSLIIRPKGLKGEDGYKTFSIRIKEKTVAQIDEVSTKTGRSRNELIGIFLDYALDQCVIEGDTASEP